jgi:hypothetical protein
MKKLVTIASVLLLTGTLHAQEQASSDTVVIPLATSSQVLLIVNDPNDLPTLEQYNYNELFSSVLQKLQGKDSIEQTPVSSIDHATSSDNEEVYWTREKNKSRHFTFTRTKLFPNTWQSFNFDLGMNNYLSDGKYPGANELYNVRPWGSWYIGLSSTQYTRISNHFSLEWGLGVNWYNFKFENNNILVTKTEDEVLFTKDIQHDNYLKSKLTASYATVTVVPMFNFGKDTDTHNRGAFRIGAGAYVGHRLASHSKLVYKEDGDKERDKNKSDFYLNNIRYGARFQIGFHSTDFFFNYDLNELFSANHGPKLNAFSFGITF